MGMMSERIYTWYTWEYTQDRNGKSTGEALQFMRNSMDIQWYKFVENHVFHSR